MMNFVIIFLTRSRSRLISYHRRNTGPPPPTFQINGVARIYNYLLLLYLILASSYRYLANQKFAHTS